MPGRLGFRCRASGRLSISGVRTAFHVSISGREFPVRPVIQWGTSSKQSAFFPFQLSGRRRVVLLLRDPSEKNKTWHVALDEFQ